MDMGKSFLRLVNFDKEEIKQKSLLRKIFTNFIGITFIVFMIFYMGYMHGYTIGKADERLNCRWECKKMQNGGLKTWTTGH